MARIARLLSLLLFAGVLGFYAWQFRPADARQSGASPQPQVLRQLLDAQKKQMERLSADPEAKELAGPLSKALDGLSSLADAKPVPASAAPELLRSEPALSDTNSLKVAVRMTSTNAPHAGPGRAVLSDGTRRYEIVSPALPPPKWIPPRPVLNPIAGSDPRSQRRWAYASLLGTIAAGVCACAWARRRLLNPS